MKRDSFIFYRSFYEAINDLPEKNQLQVYKAICELSLNFEEIDLKGIGLTIFKLIKPQLEANNQRFINGQKGGQYGSLGGRPKKPQNKPQENPKETPNNNVNVNDNINDNDIKEKVNKKKRYGEFENILLTDEEYHKLEESNLLPYIETVSSYIASTGKRYKSHYATILNWSKRDKTKQEENKNKGLSFKEQQYLREQEILDKFVRGEI